MNEAPLSDAQIDSRVLTRTTVVAAAFLMVTGFVNASTLATDAMRAGRPAGTLEPWLLEYTSVPVIILLVPLIAFYERRFALDAEGWRTALVAHAIGSVVFSMMHVAGMVGLRHLVFGIVLGRPYAFFDDPLVDLLYEYRKDVLAYAIIVLVLTLLRGVELHRQEAAAARLDARETGRLTLKLGGRTILLDAGSVEWAQAAANYVELRAGGRTHLVRISLSALEEQMNAAGIDAVRIHRSFLVNRAKIMEIIPGRDGDFRVRTADGSELRGSRRFRETLSA